MDVRREVPDRGGCVGECSAGVQSLMGEEDVGEEAAELSEEGGVGVKEVAEEGQRGLQNGREGQEGGIAHLCLHPHPSQPLSLTRLSAMQDQVGGGEDSGEGGDEVGDVLAEGGGHCRVGDRLQGCHVGEEALGVRPGVGGNEGGEQEELR